MTTSRLGCRSSCTLCARLSARSPGMRCSSGFTLAGEAAASDRVSWPAQPSDAVRSRIRAALGRRAPWTSVFPGHSSRAWQRAVELPLVCGLRLSTIRRLYAHSVRRRSTLHARSRSRRSSRRLVRFDPWAPGRRFPGGQPGACRRACVTTPIAVAPVSVQQSSTTLPQ